MVRRSHAPNLEIVSRPEERERDHVKPRSDLRRTEQRHTPPARICVSDRQTGEPSREPLNATGQSAHADPDDDQDREDGDQQNPRVLLDERAHCCTLQNHHEVGK